MTHLAYFYAPNSIAVDGWRDRLTLGCHADGSIISTAAYEELIKDSRWVGLGHYPIDKTPKNIWDKAKVK